MSKDKDSKKALNLMTRARTNLLVDQAFFGCLALHLELVEVPEDNQLGLNTMAVDGTHLFYCPKFVFELNEREITGVVAHEVMHCAYKHMTRRGHRHPTIWNWAGDYVINGDLLAAGFTLPKKRLHDKKYDNMSTEEVYERLLQNTKVVEVGWGAADESGCGGVMDAAAPGEKGKEAKVDREWDATVRMAVNVTRRANAGNLPAYLQRLVDDLKDPKVSWRELTRQFIDTSMSKDYSWMHPSRRGLAMNMILPGFVSDALQHLVFIVDVSGSIDGPMLQAMGNEVGSTLYDGTADKITVVYTDTEVKKVDEFLMGGLFKVSSPGGGGTDFDKVMQWVRENASDAACIIFLTDMMTASFGEDPGIPTLWAAYLPAATLATMKVPFGHIIHVDASP